MNDLDTLWLRCRHDQFLVLRLPNRLHDRSFISGRIDAERSIEFMTILGRIRARTLLFYGGAGHVDLENTRYTAWAPSSKR